jgi:hypothetical protein
MVQQRLIPVAVDAAILTFHRTPTGWTLAVRACPAGGRLLEGDPELYEALTHGELIDVVDATLNGWEA